MVFRFHWSNRCFSEFLTGFSISSQSLIILMGFYIFNIFRVFAHGIFPVLLGFSFRARLLFGSIPIGFSLMVKLSFFYAYTIRFAISCADGHSAIFTAPSNSCSSHSFSSIDMMAEISS